VAADVNSDSNAISAFIRNYTNYVEFPTQKLPVQFTKEQLDNASNAVAQNVLNEIIKGDGELPSIKDLLTTDVTSH